MNFIKKITAAALCVTMLAGCSETDCSTGYNLNLISPSFEYVYTYYKDSESDTDKYVECDSSEYAEYINDTTKDGIHTVTICDDSVSADDITAIVDICKTYDIPVFFVMNDIDDSYLTVYDKAYCVSADYSYIGEKFADKISTIWRDTLIDRDENQILTYSVITSDTVSDNQSRFYSALTERMTLLGIPLDLKEETALSQGDVITYCSGNKETDECFIILDNSFLPLFSDYEYYSDGIEVIGMDFSSENPYADNQHMLICSIDCTEYFTRRNLIIGNIDAKSYPFTNLDYSIIDKTVYIEPEFL